MHRSPTSVSKPRSAVAHSGIVNPVAQVGAHTKAAGVPYLVDGCQALGQLVVDVEEIGCDALTGTGRKWLRGPRGTGLLYVRSSFQHRCDPPGIDGTSAFWESASSYSLAPTAARFEEFVTEVARVAPHVYNTDEEFDRLLVVIDAL